MSRVRYAGRVRSILRRIEPSIRAEVGKEMEAYGRDELAIMQRFAPILSKFDPRRTAGAFKAALSMRFLPTSLKLKVGLIGKALNRDLFYAHILEYGRKAQTVNAKRRGSTYAMNVGALAPRHTVFNVTSARGSDLRSGMQARLKGVWARALRQAAAGATDDDS